MTRTRSTKCEPNVMRMFNALLPVQPIARDYRMARPPAAEEQAEKTTSPQRPARIVWRGYVVQPGIPAIYHALVRNADGLWRPLCGVPARGKPKRGKTTKHNLDDRCLACEVIVNPSPKARMPRYEVRATDGADNTQTYTCPQNNEGAHKAARHVRDALGFFRVRVFHGDEEIANFKPLRPRGKDKDGKAVWA